MSENYDEIIGGFSTSWLDKLKQVMSLSKMTDSDHVTSELPSCSNILKVDDFRLGDWISDC